MSVDVLQRLVDDAQSIARAAIRGVQMDRLLARTDWQAAAPRPLEEYARIHLLAIGKGGLAMAEAAAQELGGRVSRGLVIAPASHGAERQKQGGLKLVFGDHPLPSTNSANAAEEIGAFLTGCTEHDLLLVLLSGGGTSLIASFPSDVPPADGRSAFELLLRSGADIYAMNVVRKHLTRWGGGRLAAAAPCDLLTLVVSDVPGNDLSAIASGPTVPDASTFSDAIQVLESHRLWERMPASVRRYLLHGRANSALETPSADAPAFARARTKLVGTNQDALRAASSHADELGYSVEIRSDALAGEARDVGRQLALEVLDAQTNHPRCLLWGGETTVTVRGDGRGGRNQELTLGSGTVLHDARCPVVLLSVGTDGRDGPTDAAGAWVTNRTIGDARERGFVAEEYLERNDAYVFFQQAGTLFRTGATHTNVMDVEIALIHPKIGAPDEH